MCTTFYRFYFFFVCIYVIAQTIHVNMYEWKKNRKSKKKGSYRDEKIALEMEITINL